MRSTTLLYLQASVRRIHLSSIVPIKVQEATLCRIILPYVCEVCRSTKLI